MKPITSYIQSNPIRHFADESGSEYLHDLVGETEPNCVAVVQSFQIDSQCNPPKNTFFLSFSFSQTTQSASHRREYRTESVPRFCASKYRFKTTTSILNNAIGFNWLRHFNSGERTRTTTGFCTTRAESSGDRTEEARGGGRDYSKGFGRGSGRVSFLHRFLPATSSSRTMKPS